MARKEQRSSARHQQVEQPEGRVEDERRPQQEARPFDEQPAALSRDTPSRSPGAWESARTSLYFSARTTIAVGRRSEAPGRCGRARSRPRRGGLRARAASRKRKRPSSSSSISRLIMLAKCRSASSLRPARSSPAAPGAQDLRPFRVELRGVEVRADRGDDQRAAGLEQAVHLAQAGQRVVEVGQHERGADAVEAGVRQVEASRAVESPKWRWRKRRWRAVRAAGVGGRAGLEVFRRRRGRAGSARRGRSPGRSPPPGRRAPGRARAPAPAPPARRAGWRAAPCRSPRRACAPWRAAAPRPGAPGPRRRAAGRPGSRRWPRSARPPGPPPRRAGPAAARPRPAQAARSFSRVRSTASGTRSRKVREAGPAVRRRRAGRAARLPVPQPKSARCSPGRGSSSSAWRARKRGYSG